MSITLSETKVPTPIRTKNAKELGLEPAMSDNSPTMSLWGVETRGNSDNDFMAIKAVAVDDQNMQHLIIALNRDNINSLLDGDVFTLPKGIPVEITENSDIGLLFAETDEDLAKRFPPRLRPA